MKKIAAILLTVLMVISLVACGGKRESAEEITSDAGDTTEVTSTEIDSKETEQRDYLPENESTEENTVDVKTEIPYDGVFPEHEPYGTGIGAMPGRVVWAHNPDSVSWDGSGYWWETDHFDEEPILQMVNESIASLGGKDNAKDGWTALLTRLRLIQWGLIF